MKKTVPVQQIQQRQCMESLQNRLDFIAAYLGNENKIILCQSKVNYLIWFLRMNSAGLSLVQKAWDTGRNWMKFWKPK